MKFIVSGELIAQLRNAMAASGAGDSGSTHAALEKAVAEVDKSQVLQGEHENPQRLFIGWAEAFAIFSKYNKLKKGDFEEVCAEHDQVWAGHEIDIATMAPEDKARLKQLGWRESDVGGFTRFT